MHCFLNKKLVSLVLILVAVVLLVVITVAVVVNALTRCQF